MMMMIQESSDELSKAKLSAEQSSNECQHLTVECEQVRERLTEQEARSQKLCDQMLRVSHRCKTDEQVSIESHYSLLLAAFFNT